MSICCTFGIVLNSLCIFFCFIAIVKHKFGLFLFHTIDTWIEAGIMGDQTKNRKGDNKGCMRLSAGISLCGGS